MACACAHVDDTCAIVARYSMRSGVREHRCWSSTTTLADEDGPLSVGVAVRSVMTTDIGVPAPVALVSFIGVAALAAGDGVGRGSAMRSLRLRTRHTRLARKIGVDRLHAVGKPSRNTDRTRRRARAWPSWKARGMVAPATVEPLARSMRRTGMSALNICGRVRVPSRCMA